MQLFYIKDPKVPISPQINNENQYAGSSSKNCATIGSSMSEIIKNTNERDTLSVKDHFLAKTGKNIPQKKFAINKGIGSVK
jgi:hypothetical protein